VISVFVLTEALDLGIGQFSTPGPGFVLFWASLVFGVLSIVLMVRAVIKKGQQCLLCDPFKGVKWRNALVTIIALFVYGSLLTQLGFLLATFGLMVLLFTLGKVKRWITISGAFLTVILAYGIFHFVLQIQFPRGVVAW
jgi:hypothetical protein